MEIQIRKSQKATWISVRERNSGSAETVFLSWKSRSTRSLENLVRHMQKNAGTGSSHNLRPIFLGCYPKVAYAQATLSDHLVPGTPLDVTVPENGRVPWFQEVHHMTRPERMKVWSSFQRQIIKYKIFVTKRWLCIKVISDLKNCNSYPLVSQCFHWFVYNHSRKQECQ